MPSRPHDAYSLLGISHFATTEEIESAYEYKVAEQQMKCNADEIGEREFGAMIEALNTAHICLTDPVQRKYYDLRAGVEEPRRREPEVKMVFSEDEGKPKKKVKLVKPGGAMWRQREFQKKQKQNEKAVSRKKEDALRRKLKKQLDDALKRR